MELTEQQVAIKRMVANFARAELLEHAFKPESDEQYHSRLRKLARQGLLGMTAPVEYGGGGLSYFDAVLAGGEGGGHGPQRAAPGRTQPPRPPHHPLGAGTTQTQKHGTRART